ncbi:MAG: hypothetical protein ACLP9K_09745 [Nitrososphaerales archaeon]|jgi:hypothetical protein
MTLATYSGLTPTPAQVAGVGVEGKNKWLALLTEAVNNRDTTSHS